MIKTDRLLSQQQIYNFLRSTNIKYEPFAHYINDRLSRGGVYVDYEDKTTWKYFLNLAGHYHSSDTPMYVISLDTRESILFSPENLSKNLRTRAVYSPGGAYYNRLKDTYPDQVDLIKSILFPVASVQKAIDADDLTLLSYGKGYLEAYEESRLIVEVEQFLAIVKERWYFDFLDDEPLFDVTFWGSLWTQLAMLLLTARKSNIKTPYVHSSDIWDQLGAYGLDNYSDVLSREKAMMLYQNIRYFKENAGKQSNLIILQDKLLKDLGIGLYGRYVVQEAETGADDYQLTPQLVSVLLPANSEALPANVEIKTVATIQSEIFEKGLTPSNSAEKVAAVERQLGDTTLNEFATKFLEIRPIAQRKPYAEQLNLFLLETLIVSIKEGYYTKPVEVFDPLTNNPIYLPPSELLALYNYAVHQSLGITIENFPTEVLLHQSFTPTIGIPGKKIQYLGETIYLSQYVEVNSYLADLAYDVNIDNPLEFSKNATDLWLRYMAHYLEDQNTLIDSKHAVLQYLSGLCHQSRVDNVELVKGYDTYQDWLGSGGIDIYSTILNQYEIQIDPKEQWSNLADEIISKLIPINDTLLYFGNYTLANSGYNRLRQLFIQLCSYRVVFLESERDTADYSIGAKWSNRYGPDDFHTFTDFIIATNVDTVNTLHNVSETVIHPGFKEILSSSVEANGEYTNAFVSTDVASQTTHSGYGVDSVSEQQSVMTGTGSLNLPYSKTIANIPDF